MQTLKNNSNSASEKDNSGNPRRSNGKSNAYLNAKSLNDKRSNLNKY